MSPSAAALLCALCLVVLVASATAAGGGHGGGSGGSGGSGNGHGHGGSDDFYDTTCRPRRFTAAGLRRLEPIKASNLGRFNCTGTLINFDPATGHVLSFFNLGYFEQSTEYVASCGCWVTTSYVQGPSNPFIVREYGNALPGRAEEGTCFPFEWAENDGSTTSSVAVTRNVAFVHRDVTYLRREDSSLVAHQTLYLVPHTQDELVFIRKLNAAGRIEQVQNLSCQMVEPQQL